MFSRLMYRWKQYRYRFTPWIALKFKERTVRRVIANKNDKIIDDENALLYLQSFLLRLEKLPPLELTSSASSISHDIGYTKSGRRIGSNYSEASDHVTGIITDIPSTHSKDIQKTFTVTGDFQSTELSKIYADELLYDARLDVMCDTLGFSIKRKKSKISEGGTGVFITRGHISSGSLVSVYPGCVYQPWEPLFFQSLGNPFIFRCLDGVFIDGHDKKLSKYIFRSCSQRDRHGPYMTCDDTWMTAYPKNPLAIGQYVNNQSKKYPANVAYQEIDIPHDFPFHLRKYIPNINFSSSIVEAETIPTRLMRMIVLVATRDIAEGEEILSTYFTVVQ